jgi:nitrate reductase gamma subunit
LGGLASEIRAGSKQLQGRPRDTIARRAPSGAWNRTVAAASEDHLHHVAGRNEEFLIRDFINHALFGWYPYLCLTVFLIGSWVRFDREQFTWRSGSSQLLRRRQLIWGSNLFHVGILVIFLGHLVGLLTPIWVFDALGISHTFKQWMAIVIGGLAGVVCFVGATLLIHRRLFDARIRKTSSFGDIAILLLLYAQLILGMASIYVSLQHLDGHEMVKFMTWAQGILTLQPGVWTFVADAHWIFKLHLFLGMTIFLVFPFTRLVHIWSAPVWYVGRRGYQIVRTTNGSRPRGVTYPEPAE